MLNLDDEHIEPPDSSLDTLEALLASRLGDGQLYTEYELIRWLKRPTPGVFKADALRDSLTLFRCHFLVMHCLYRLRLTWLAARSGWLDIDPLGVQLKTWTAEEASANQTVCESDPLARYYLDLSNLSTDREAVDNLLRGVWQPALTPDQRRKDLELLELEEPASEIDIRKQYRRLAMRHHPDRGGDVELFQSLLAAYQRLTV